MQPNDRAFDLGRVFTRAAPARFMHDERYDRVLAAGAVSRSFRIGLPLGRCALEGVERLAVLVDRHERRVLRKIALEAPGVEHLRNEATVRHTRRVAMAELPRGRIARQPGFERLETFRDPVALVPRVLRIVGYPCTPVR